MTINKVAGRQLTFHVCVLLPSTSFHLLGRIITKGKLPDLIKLCPLLKVAPPPGRHPRLSSREGICSALFCPTQRFHSYVSSTWVRKGKTLPACVMHCRLQSHAGKSTWFLSLSNCALVFITDFQLGVKFAQGQSMTGAGYNIHLFDLGPSEALANRWSLNLPWASDITNKQPGPGPFFYVE